MWVKLVPEHWPFACFLRTCHQCPPALKVAEVDEKLPTEHERGFGDAAEPPEGRRNRMVPAKSFPQEQRGIALRMMAALCVTVLVLATCLLRSAAAHASLAERLSVTARADVFVLCWLAAAIGNVARLRFFSAADIGGSGFGTATADVGRANAVLQNTLEQVALAVPIHVALTMLVASSAPLVVALVALFAVGRLLFWIGYARGAKARAFGFALTFYPSIAGLMIAAVAGMRLSP